MENNIRKQNSEFSPLLFIHTNVLNYLKVLSIVMLAMSLLYLMAANWWMLPKFVRLIIPMLVLLSSAIASIHFVHHRVLQQCLDAVSGVMLGLSLAVIGQIYQTGADSYLLFLVWGILLLPWLYRPNIGIYIMLMIVSQLALYLFFKQTFWMVRAEEIYIIALNFLAALSMIYGIRHYPRLRFIFIVFIILISVLCMVRFIASSQLIYLVSVFLLPVLAAFYFYSLKKVLECTLLIAGVAFSLSLWLLDQVGGELTNSAEGLFVLALLIFAWFAAISFVLTRMFPTSKLVMIPLAIGAWIAGIILSILLLTFWQAFSVVMGIVFVIISWVLLHKYSSFFIRQFAYCLWVCGQIAILVHIGLLTDNLWWVWFIQLAILCLTAFMRKHWFILAIQLIVSHILGIVSLFLTDTFEYSDVLLNIMLGVNTFIFIICLMTSRYWQSSFYMKSIVLWMLLILFGTAASQIFLGFYHPHFDEVRFDQIIVLYILPFAFISCFTFQQFKSFNHVSLWLIPFLGVLLITLGYFEIFIVLLLMAWAIVYRYRWVQVLCIVLLIFWLWMLYYNLGISFLYKSLTIFISGLMVMAMVYALQKNEGSTVSGEI